MYLLFAANRQSAPCQLKDANALALQYHTFDLVQSSSNKYRQRLLSQGRFQRLTILSVMRSFNL